MSPDPTYDVFLSHASPDKPQVEELARRLKRRRLKPFLDTWHLVPGEPWQEALEEALKQSRTVAIFLGPSGIRPWQNEEMRTALATRTRDKNRRVIPVLLPDALMPQDEDLPPFLARLTWVDFRGGLDDADVFRRLVRGIKGLPPGDSPAPTPAPSQPARATMIGVPHQNSFFTGREALLSRLHQKLQARGISALAQAAVYGLGGIGKTQTAIEYAHRFAVHYRFILWAVAESEPAIRAAYLSIARELGLVQTQADLETAVLAVKAWLAREDGWLLVLDNADDPGLVRAFLPSARTGGKILLTSRAKSFTTVGIREPFRVETLDPEDAVKFLTDRTGNTDAQTAAELAAELGFLPLALEQAASYIETVGGGFAEYLARYRRQGMALLAKGKPSTDYPETVATTWMLTFGAVREASPASAELLTAAAFLAPDSIPIEIFTRGGWAFGGWLSQELRGADKDPLGFWELLEPLERYSLVERSPDQSFRLHRLTQDVVKDSLGEEGRLAWAERVVRALDAVYSPPLRKKMIYLNEKLYTHVLQARDHIRYFKILNTSSGGLLTHAGNYVGGTVGRELLEQGLEIQKRVLGDHPDTLFSMMLLGARLYGLGDDTAVSKLDEQILQMRDRALSGEHLATLIPRANLAEAFGGNIARELYEKNLEICERLLGTEHPDTTKSTWNLLLTVRNIGDRDAETRLIDKLRWLLDRDKDSIPSVDQRIIRQKLLDLLSRA